jgi:two-component system, NtrC family, sensor kinase
VNIRPKIIAWIAALFVILGFAEVLLVQHIIMPSFAELERSDAATAMRRIQYAFDLTLERLRVLAIDWGNWALVYRFMENRDPQSLEADITISNMREIGVNLVLIVDPNGSVVYSRTVDLPAGQTVDLTSRAALPEEFPWRAGIRDGQPAKGLLATNLGTFMLAGGPILDGDGHGPSRGMMILGRLLQAGEIKNIADLAQSDLSLLPAAARRRPDRLTQTATLTHVDRDFTDLYAHPLLTLRVNVPRDISAHGRKAVAYASLSLLAAAIVVVLLLVAVISRVILNPLAVLTRHAVRVGDDQDLMPRLDLPRRDEIGVLAREFDNTVARLAESRSRLVDQSFAAGFAELAKGVLHNLGNAMTPIGVRLQTLMRRLRNAPTVLAEQAAAELKAGPSDPQRSADLHDFLLLACQEIAAAVRAAEADVAAMTHQAAVIGNLLAEQMRSARQEHVIEAVGLPELLDQALEIVPEGHRRRLAIQSEPSLQHVGTVRTARTILRLVLQNLIINAAEAVRGAGKTRGTLRVTAEIHHEAGQEQLHLVFEDDGAGVAAQDLARLFDKRAAGNVAEATQAIGLHWCANAINALGGRIWAASEGPGRGTSMHLMIPTARPTTGCLAAA